MERRSRKTAGTSSAIFRLVFAVRGIKDSSRRYLKVSKFSAVPREVTPHITVSGAKGQVR